MFSSDCRFIRILSSSWSPDEMKESHVIPYMG